MYINYYVYVLHTELYGDGDDDFTTDTLIRFVSIHIAAVVDLLWLGKNRMKSSTMLCRVVL